MNTFKSYWEQNSKVRQHISFAEMANHLHFQLDSAGRPEMFATPMQLDSLTNCILNEAAKKGITMLSELFLASRVFILGPKIFRPSYEDCLALEQMDLRLSCSEYQQSFPTMVVEFPEKFRERYRCEVENFEGIVNPSVPVFVVVHHEPSVPGIVCSTNWNNDMAILRIIHHYGNSMPTIEEVLRKVATLPPGSNDITTAEEYGSIRCQRLALNACQLLCYYGMQSRPENPSDFARKERHVAAAKKRNDGSLARAEEELRSAPVECDFAHKVTLYNRSPRMRDGIPSGITVRMHWVRGHMRRQPYGPGNTLRKLIHIKPYLVHPEDADGATPPMPIVYEGVRS